MADDSGQHGMAESVSDRSPEGDYPSEAHPAEEAKESRDGNTGELEANEPLTAAVASSGEQAQELQEALRGEREAAASLRLLLQQEREARSALEAQRRNEELASKEERDALRRQLREAEERCRAAEEEGKRLAGEMRVAEGEKEAMVKEAEALVERIEECEGSIEALRRENENLEALLVAARRSRDTYWKHSVVMFQEKSKMEEELALLNKVASGFSSATSARQRAAARKLLSSHISSSVEKGAKKEEKDKEGTGDEKTGVEGPSKREGKSKESKGGSDELQKADSESSMAASEVSKQHSDDCFRPSSMADFLDSPSASISGRSASSGRQGSSSVPEDEGDGEESVQGSEGSQEEKPQKPEPPKPAPQSERRTDKHSSKKEEKRDTGSAKRREAEAPALRPPEADPPTPAPLPVSQQEKPASQQIIPAAKPPTVALTPAPSPPVENRPVVSHPPQPVDQQQQQQQQQQGGRGEEPPPVHASSGSTRSREHAGAASLPPLSPRVGSSKTGAERAAAVAREAEPLELQQAVSNRSAAERESEALFMASLRDDSMERQGSSKAQRGGGSTAGGKPQEKKAWAATVWAEGGDEGAEMDLDNRQGSGQGGERAPGNQGGASAVRMPLSVATSNHSAPKSSLREREREWQMEEQWAQEQERRGREAAKEQERPRSMRETWGFVPASPRRVESELEGSVSGRLSSVSRSSSLTPSEALAAKIQARQGAQGGLTELRGHLRAASFRAHHQAGPTVPPSASLEDYRQNAVDSRRKSIAAGQKYAMASQARLGPSRIPTPGGAPSARLAQPRSDVRASGRVSLDGRQPALRAVPPQPGYAALDNARRASLAGGAAAAMQRPRAGVTPAGVMRSGVQKGGGKWR